MRRRGVLSLAAQGLVWTLPSCGQTVALPATRRVKIGYEVVLTGQSPGLVSLWLPVPQSDENQTIADLQFSGASDFKVQSGRNGNRYFFARVPARHTVRMDLQVTRTARTRPLASVRNLATPNCCLAPDRLVPVDGRIRTWAQEVVARSKAVGDLAMARAIYEHIVDTVKYDKSGKGWGRGDIYYACDNRRGNCSDFHAIFIGYARALGIPAKFAIGFPLPTSRGNGEVAGYHCWAEFFARGIGWVPIDASEAAKDPARRHFFFGSLDENRVELSQGRDLLLTPRQAGQPLNFFVYPYAEQNGQLFAGVQSRLTYQDL